MRTYFIVTYIPEEDEEDEEQDFYYSHSMLKKGWSLAHGKGKNPFKPFAAMARLQDVVGLFLLLLGKILPLRSLVPMFDFLLTAQGLGSLFRMRPAALSIRFVWHLCITFWLL